MDPRPPKARGRAKKTHTTDFRSDVYVARREAGWTQAAAMREAGISRYHAYRLDEAHGFSTKSKQRGAPEAEPHQTIREAALDSAVERDRAAALPRVDPEPELAPDNDPTLSLMIEGRHPEVAPTKEEAVAAYLNGDPSVMAAYVGPRDMTGDPATKRYRGDDAVRLEVTPDGFPAASQQVDPRFAAPHYAQSQDARMRVVKERRQAARSRWSVT